MKMKTYPSTQDSSDPCCARLPAPSLAKAKGGVVDPAWNKAVITIKPYPMMTSGDEVRLRWHGINNEGDPYRHETSRFVTERQVGRDVVFVVREPHIAELDGGSLEISYQVAGKWIPGVLGSQPLQLEVGDRPELLLPPIADDAVGGSLDPARVPEGTRVTIRPYSRMALGDRLALSVSQDSKALWHDVLHIEEHALGREVSFWIDPSYIAPYVGHRLSLDYVVRHGRSARKAESLSVHIGPLVRPALKAPRVTGLDKGGLDIETLQGPVTVVIDGAGLAAGEWVGLQCNGTYTHVQDREITEAMVGQPLVFEVPAAYWQEQRNRSVQLFYQVERLDDVSQRSVEITIEVRTRTPG